MPHTPLKETVSFDDFARLDLRVATITAAEAHPNADRLLKLQLNLGFEQRQICAGVKAYYEPEALVGRQIIVVANLAPRKIRGEVSNGMLLAASVTHPPPSADTGEAEPAPAPDAQTSQAGPGSEPELVDVVLLAPSAQVPPGSTVG